MEISSMYGNTGTSLIESIYGQNSKTSSEQTKSGTSFFGTDTVTISEEAKEMLASLTVQKSEEENVQEEQTQQENETGTGAASGGGGSDSSNSNDSKIQNLKSKLASLQSSLGSASGTEAADISAQIGQIMGEIAALEAESAG